MRVYEVECRAVITHLHMQIAAIDFSLIRRPNHLRPDFFQLIRDRNRVFLSPSAAD